MGFDYTKYRLEHSRYIAVKRLIADYREMAYEYEAILHASKTADGMPRGGGISDTTGQKAIKLADLSAKLNAIWKGLQVLPQEYQMPIFEHIAYKKPYDIPASEATLRRWQYVFVYEVSKLLAAAHLEPYYLGKNRLN